MCNKQCFVLETLKEEDELLLIHQKKKKNNLGFSIHWLFKEIEGHEINHFGCQMIC